MTSSPSQRSLDQLVAAAQRASPNDRIDLRDSVAEHGLAAIQAMLPFARDSTMQRFAVRVIGRVGRISHRNAAVAALGEMVSAAPALNAEVQFELSALRSLPLQGPQMSTPLRGTSAGTTTDQAAAAGTRAPRRLTGTAVTDEHHSLLGAVASVIADYRAGQSGPMDAAHVGRWVRQFNPDAQIPILRELRHVLGQTYLGRERVRTYLATLVKSPPRAGVDPRLFWRSANFLDIQQNGESQREMLNLFEGVLRSEFALELGECGGSAGPFIYLDDGIFSGGRVRQDLRAWIHERAPSRAVVFVLTMVSHTYGDYDIQRNLRELAQTCGKEIELILRPDVVIENRVAYRDLSQVLWPAILPDDPEVLAYVSNEAAYPFQPRSPDGASHRVFSSEEGRQLLESELLVAGLKIRSKHRDPKPHWRPLGFSQFGLGFGSMIVTYRNCPNNAPLALWWGFGGWYPLFRRTTYASVSHVDDIPF